MPGPDVSFWQQRFERDDLPWDRGAPNPHLAVWLAQGALRPGRVLVPGCGSGHEVVALAQAGFDVTALDYAPAAVARTRERVQRAGLHATVVETDVLHWPARQSQPAAQRFDAVYEQTCLCALHPDHWVAYGAQLHAWLAPGGVLALLAMQAPREGARDGRIEGPPYHVGIHALRALLPGAQWHWPAPPYSRVPLPGTPWYELALPLERR